jgi:hypothetical protein
MSMRALPLLVAIALLACAHAPFDLAGLDARTMRGSVVVDGGEVKFHAIPFPLRARVRPSSAPLVVLEPMLFDRALLLAPEGLVASLENAGASVWLVGPDARPLPTARAWSYGIASAVERVGTASGSPRVDVLALGLSGPAALLAVGRLGLTHAAIGIDKLVLLGTPLDDAYPGNFAARTQTLAGGPAAAMCGLDQGTACARAFRDPNAIAWLDSFPTRDASDALPAAERFPFLRGMHGPAVLFVAGKVDGIAPSESSFPVFEQWGRDVGDEHGPPKRFFLAGPENGLPRDYDAFSLLAPDDQASAVWNVVLSFLKD